MAEILDQLDDATNVLVAEPPMSTGRDLCTSLLVDREPDASVLFVSYTRSAQDCLDQLSDPDALANIGIITVGDAMTSVDRPDVETENVSTASDLTGLGIQIGQFLSDHDGPVFVCFDSLTSMLQYVDFETAYEFLHAITGQIFAAGASAHFHIDPSAHDPKQVAGITSLFDAKVSLEDDEVRTRDVIQTPS